MNNVTTVERNQSIFKYQIKSLVKVPLKVWDDPEEGAVHVARSIALAIRQKQEEGERLVLGLATGSSPLKVYEELIRLHKNEGLSFYNVHTFNLDEYYPMSATSRHGYVYFMWHHLFDHIDIDKNNVHIPDGTVPLEEVEAYCADYEKRIEDLGGIDIQLLGIGRSGHIGFNEPGSRSDSLTRLVRLDGITRADAVEEFGALEKVPYRAITMGIRSILKAKTVFLMAWGNHKAEVVKKAVEEPITSNLPASFLQLHDNVKFVIDKAAEEQFTRVKTPWLVGMCNWNDDLIAKAVIWLSQKINKPILKLTPQDYSDNELSDLILEYDSAYNINIKVFNKLQHGITGWPGGKPNADDTNRPERALPAKKRVVIFSPHPDDDVISMGGTFLRLVDQGHEVHVAYQTSGNIAVHDYDTQRFMEFYKEFGDIMQDDVISDESLKRIIRAIKQNGSRKQPSKTILKVNALIRRGEARAGARFCGLTDDRIHFLDMPFYETGKAKKKSLSDEDVDIVVNLLETIKPHQVYAAGELADPHGTHRVCLNAILSAFDRVKHNKWSKDCWLWLYRGAWQEWNIDEIEMAVPLSPDELIKKRKAIFMHQTQKDQPPFPGVDQREFWQRAEERNKKTAETFRKLGLADYEAMEAFVRWKF